MSLGPVGAELHARGVGGSPAGRAPASRGWRRPRRRRRHRPRCWRPAGRRVTALRRAPTSAVRIDRPGAAPAVGVPDAHRAVAPRGDELPSVGARLDGVDPVVVRVPHREGPRGERRLPQHVLRLLGVPTLERPQREREAQAGIARRGSSSTCAASSRDAAMSRCAFRLAPLVERHDRDRGDRRQRGRAARRTRAPAGAGATAARAARARCSRRGTRAPDRVGPGSPRSAHSCASASRAPRYSALSSRSSRVHSCSARLRLRWSLQVVAVLLDPVAQPRPLAQQRLVGELDAPRADRQQPRRRRAARSRLPRRRRRSPRARRAGARRRSTPPSGSTSASRSSTVRATACWAGSSRPNASSASRATAPSTPPVCS